MAKRRHGWGREYARYLLRMARRNPRVFLRRAAAWNVYAFAPRVTRRPSAPPVFRCADVAGAVAAFRRDGFVVLCDALPGEDAALLHGIVEQKAHDIVRRHDEGLLPAEMMHGQVRYSYGEYGHNPEWEFLAHNDRITGVLRGIWEGVGFRAVAAGGDFVLPGGTWQALHNDMAWKAAGEALPRVLIVNYYVSDVQEINGPIRIVPGTARFPVPPHRVIERFEPQWMKETTLTGKPGYAVIRDPRTWHGGTPNSSGAPRYMPAIEFVMSDAPEDEIDGTAILDQMSRNSWIAEFANA